MIAAELAITVNVNQPDVEMLGETATVTVATSEGRTREGVTLAEIPSGTGATVSCSVSVKP